MKADRSSFIVQHTPYARRVKVTVPDQSRWTMILINPGRGLLIKENGRLDCWSVLPGYWHTYGPCQRCNDSRQ